MSVNDEIEPAAAAPTAERNNLDLARSGPTERRLGQPHHAARPHHAEPSLGELRAQHRELHLCLRCAHHMVCGMAKSLDPNLLVTIASCLAFEPADADGSSDVCELLPLEPLPST